ncbi:MAG: HEAT repeat domain-containing protein [Desulfobacterales bacterium]|nr:HEAT repeat domain-containing protein [Desulfobacterales bacterium]
MTPTDKQLPIRQLKKIVLDLLHREDFESALEEILALPPRRSVNPLFSFLYHGDPQTRWRAVTALGAVTAALAVREMEPARVVFRRLMWSLNEESGGIGWGSPEAMGEIMARHWKMREEYLSILLSFLDPEGNFLEHEGLQQGALWAAGRVAQVDPAPVRETAPLIRPFLISQNASLRATAAWACGAIEDQGAAESLRSIADDPAGVQLWIDRTFTATTVGRIARRALEKMSISC